MLPPIVPGGVTLVEVFLVRDELHVSPAAAYGLSEIAVGVAGLACSAYAVPRGRPPTPHDPQVRRGVG